MTVKECATWLLENGYAVIVHNTLILTAKFTEQLNLQSQEPTIKVVKPDDKKEIWNKFCTDAEIPHRVSSPHGGVYTVRQYSPSMAIKLKNIIDKVDYRRLVESTKHYYKTVSYKALLSNYLDKEIWRSEYEAWKENKPVPNNDGSSMLED